MPHNVYKKLPTIDLIDVIMSRFLSSYKEIQLRTSFTKEFFEIRCLKYFPLKHDYRGSLFEKSSN